MVAIYFSVPVTGPCNCAHEGSAATADAISYTVVFHVHKFKTTWTKSYRVSGTQSTFGQCHIKF